MERWNGWKPLFSSHMTLSCQRRLISTDKTFNHTASHIQYTHVQHLHRKIGCFSADVFYVNHSYIKKEIVFFLNIKKHTVLKLRMTRNIMVFFSI